jgi:hypothetical protein
MRPTAADFDEFNMLVIDQFRARAGQGDLRGVQAPVILLHHQGRKTGQERVVPVAYLAQLHPEWEEYERLAAPRVIPVLVLGRHG